jgi:GNAT superfamily N-acetyltransferase
MYHRLHAILEPPAPAARARRRREYIVQLEHNAIPVITKHGRALNVRPVTPGDAPLLATLLASLSERSTRLRFFRPLKDITTIWREAARVAGHSSLLQTALVATSCHAAGETAVGLAELCHDASDPTVADFAIVVSDAYQREGVGQMLSQLLVQVAMLRGVQTLRVDMLAENVAIRKLVRSLGLPYNAETHRGETRALLRLPRS